MLCTSCQSSCCERAGVDLPANGPERVTSNVQDHPRREPAVRAWRAVPFCRRLVASCGCTSPVMGISFGPRKLNVCRAGVVGPGGGAQGRAVGNEFEQGRNQNSEGHTGRPGGPAPPLRMIHLGRARSLVPRSVFAKQGRPRRMGRMNDQIRHTAGPTSADDSSLSWMGRAPWSAAATRFQPPTPLTPIS